MEAILTVDENDNITGEQDKLKCHMGDGILHRAFLLMVFDRRGRILLARRSEKKLLWPGFWDGTVASHIHRGETYEEAAGKRLLAEMGITAEPPQFLLKFIYFAPYLDVGSEREVCGLLQTVIDDDCKFSVNPDEVSEYFFTDPENVQNLKNVAPWFILALNHMQNCSNRGDSACKNTVL